MEDERVMIFIDGNNLYHELKGHFGRSDLDFGKFCKKLTGQRLLIRTYYYNAPVDVSREPDRHERQQRFFRSLQRIPYFELRLGRLVYFDWPKQSPMEKGVDVKLATDMLVHAFRNSYDTAILVSADTDYAAALQAVKDQGKHVEVGLFGDRQSSLLLREISDRTVEIDKAFLRGCWGRAPKEAAMTEDKDTRKRLLGLLDRTLFDPVLGRRREDFLAPADKHRFDDARRKVAEERQRYHDNCPTAQDIKENFLRDLKSRTSQRLNDNLRDLGLPTYWDVKDEFLKLCTTYEV